MPLEFIIKPDPKSIIVFHKRGKRFVKCFCGKDVEKSIVPHMRKEHQLDWKQWCLNFVELYNQGYSERKIGTKSQEFIKALSMLSLQAPSK